MSVLLSVVRMAARLEESARETLGDIIREVARNHGYDRLKEQQLLAIGNFVSGSDVFVSLPTGFGKALIYGLLPAVFDRLKGYTKPTSIALVISPLASLMMDQKARFLPRGISAEFLGDIQHDARALQRVKEGHHKLVFLTPENLFHGLHIREMLMAESFQSKLIAFVVDEAHCIKKWSVYIRIQLSYFYKGG